MAQCHSDLLGQRSQKCLILTHQCCYLISLKARFRATWVSACLPACLPDFHDTPSLWEKTSGFPHSKAEGPNFCKSETEKNTKDLNIYLCKQFMQFCLSWEATQRPDNWTNLSERKEEKKGRKIFASKSAIQECLWRIQIPIQSLHIAVCM